MIELDPLAANKKSPRNPVLTGILLITVGVFALSVMDALVKWLVTGTYSPLQLLAVRSWISMPVFLLMSYWQGGFSAIRTQRLPAHLTRGVIGVCAPLLFFYSLKSLPLADAVALFFSSTFIMTALSALWLGEQVGKHRWGSVVVGFIGVLIITQPGVDTFRIETIYVLLASIAYSIFILSGRWLSRTESTFSLVFYYNLVVLVLCSATLPWQWQAMPADILLFMMVFAALALLGHFALTHAFSLAPVGAIAPYEYSAMVWAVVLGFLVWGDIPSIATFSGMLIIVVSGLYLLHREALARQREKDRE